MNLMIMSVDVEDWFQVENLRSAYPLNSWNDVEIRLHTSLDKLLEVFDARSVKATFFIVGYIAERVPEIVRKIAAAGHELGLHTYQHRLLNELKPQDFRMDLRRCRSIIEDLSGVQVEGFRAPSFSITDWALDIIAEEGLKYDSSYHPSSLNRRFGKLEGVPSIINSEAPWMVRDGLWELPLPTLSIGGKGIPWCGGGYFRLIPYQIFKKGIHHILNKAGYYNFFIHPWELDPEQPRVKDIPLSYYFRHYVSLEKTQEKIERLISDFRFTTTKEVIRRLV